MRRLRPFLPAIVIALAAVPASAQNYASPDALLATFGHWSAYEETVPPVCFASTFSLGTVALRGNVRTELTTEGYLHIAFGPQYGPGASVSVDLPGIDADRASPVLRIGAERFRFFSQNGSHWPLDPDDDARIAELLTASDKTLVQFSFSDPAHGQVLAVFSTSGARAARSHVERRCLPALS